MKKVFSTILLVILVTSLIITGCGEKSKKDFKEADEHMKEANEDLVDATKAASSESMAKLNKDWKTFKHEADTTFTSMERNIKKLKEKIAKAGKIQKNRTQENIKNLEQKLSVQKQKLAKEDQKMKDGLQNFDQTVGKKNESFQKEFRHDMHELATAIQDLFTDNVK